VIEVVSWPPVLSQWIPAEQPYYFELYGETSPVLDTALAEVIPAHAGIYPKDTEAIWVPGPDARTFIELMIAPELPGTAR
jgi:hypothetical protein